MTRPLLWAWGVLVSAVVSGTAIGPRLRSAGLAPTGAEAVPATGDTLVLQQDLRGHYTVHPLVEGRTVRMLVDTGATTCTLSEEDAAAAGLRVGPHDFTRAVSTANGTVMVAPVRIRELRVGGIVVRDVEAMVVPRGRLGTSLLGMSFLRRLQGFEVAAGRLTLRG